VREVLVEKKEKETSFVRVIEVKRGKG